MREMFETNSIYPHVTVFNTNGICNLPWSCYIKEILFMTFIKVGTVFKLFNYCMKMGVEFLKYFNGVVQWKIKMDLRE